LRKEKKYFENQEYNESISSTYENIESNHITKTEQLSNR
jgi:hypothetical protein